MKIALIGYGKMGKAIEEIAIQSGHEIVLKIDADNFQTEFTADNIKQADVAIEFTSPHTAVDNIKKCFSWGIPVVSGSTGWLENWNQVVDCCKAENGCFLYASNFSIGVNIFFELNKYLARMMANKAGYDISVEEIHHTQKKDAPSGTAITIAEGIVENNKEKTSWVNEPANDPHLLSIISKRIDPAPGTHIVKYLSEIDDIEIIHTAHNRKGFATGAVKAAEYIVNKKGIFTMNDVLGLGLNV